MTEGMSTAARGSLRQEQAEATRRRLVEAAVAVIEDGRQCTMRSTAKEAGVAERTIYRYFESREQLAEAIGEALGPRAGAPLPDSTAELSQYARRLFTTFDDNARLVTNMVFGAALEQDFERSRAKNLADLRAIIDRDYPRAGLRDRRAAAASLRALLSGAGWVYLRISCGLPNAEVIRSAQWSIDTALQRLGRAPRRR